MRALRNEIKPAASARSEIQPGIWLDSRRAVWFAAERLLAIADLHWGYAVSHQARGHLLPIWGDDELAARLLALLADYSPVEMIWLGDIVHAAEGAARAEAFLRTAPVPVALVTGNHDRHWRPKGVVSTIRGRYFFHHGDTSPPVPAGLLEVIGHHHPAVSWWDGAGASVKLPALVASPQRLVLPAFSPWAAGMPWTATAGGQETLWAVAPARIFSLPRVGSPQPTSAA